MRYSKQEIVLGKESQKKLGDSKVSIIGIGALGTSVLEMLARTGIGNIKIIDRDVIEISNLHRQKLFTEEDVNKPKVIVAKERVLQINSNVKIESFMADLDFDNIHLLQDSDLILDCTDNIYTRFLINDFAKKKNIPWIFASVIRTKGMVMSITDKTPCFSCVFADPEEPLETCDTAGILSTAPSALAAIQATEAIKIITKKDYNKNLIHYDLWNNKITEIKTKFSKNCRPCNGVFEHIEGKKTSDFIKICGSCNYQVNLGKKINLGDLHKRINGEKTVTNECLILSDAILFSSGKALIKADTKEKAKIILSKYFG